ncbi:hypothetical protein [Allorhizobium undicola]|uniref:hypothetical protein n=1 Tax=Allorhizobium undicola TaxID=78527 RepID=UPI000686A611|nr:hypothetical protein [Allorhizobium undicola]
MKKEDRRSAIAAATILLAFGLSVFLMPKLVLWIGNYSPTLAALAGAAVLLSFFAVLWVRARYQRVGPKSGDRFSGKSDAGN